MFCIRLNRHWFFGVVIGLACYSHSTLATTIYGTLGNFDCINDTGETAHGFEIELEGIDPSDVYHTFGSPYNRYGTPTIDTDGTKTYVRYESSYSGGVWAAGTESGSYAPTGGHSLYYPQYGGSPDYPNVPGDHFGIALRHAPTNTVYHWLLDDGSGSLVKAGTNVMVPAPVLNVAPPANPANPAAVRVVVQAPPLENEAQFGEAIWAKVFTTVVENPENVELEDLVLGNPVIPPDSETEVEWFLLQTDPENPDANELEEENDIGDGHESVTRRYEYYKYTGGFDPENHEALNDNYDPMYVGDYLGTQNVGVNFAPVPEPGTMALAGLGVTCLLLASHRRRIKN